jgi:coproporphyrinogen III oxidase-like Fe-S oxidoreductase
MIDHLAARDPGFGIYVHWPFCASKCPYCDFNSHVRSAPIDELRFVKAFERELDYQKQISGSREVSSIFFGGGTPSLMHADTIGAILDAIARRWTVSPHVEITMEANPTSVEAQRHPERLASRARSVCWRGPAYVSIRQHTPAYVSIRHVSIRQHTSAYLRL